MVGSANKSRKGGRPRTAAADRPAQPGRHAPPGPAVVLGVIALLVLASYLPHLGQGFSNDDFTILDKVRGRSLAWLVGWHDLLAGWWRPLSRELHFAILDRAFPGSSTACHAVNLGLWLGIVALTYVLLRRLAGPALAVPALAGALAASCWGLFVLWASASQDLWMLLFGLAFLVAFDAGRALAAAVCLLGALLAKETAVVLVPLALWLRLRREGGGWPGARQVLPSLVVLLAWIAVHPSLGGRLALGSGGGIVPVPARAFSWWDVLWLAAPFNLEYEPGLSAGLPLRAVEGGVWALGLAGLAYWALLAAPSLPGEARRRLLVLGLGWWMIAWSPMLAPFLRWHSYYGWIGLPGLWLALTALGAGRGPWVVVLLAVAAYLRPFEAHAPVDDWGTEQYQRSAAANLELLRDGLREHLPTLPPRSRVFLGALPNGVGFHTGLRQSTPLRVWYRDSTASGCLFSEYVRRPANDPGRDWFFVVTPDVRLLPVADGRMPVPDSLRREPLWPAAEEHLAHTFSLAGEHEKACDGFARLAATFPGDARHAFNFAEALEARGDRQLGTLWRNRADSLVGSPPRHGDAFLEWEARSRP